MSQIQNRSVTAFLGAPASGGGGPLNVGSLWVKGNATLTIIGSSGVWTDINFSPVVALASNSTSQWELADGATGELKYVGAGPIVCLLTGLFALIAGATTTIFESRMVVNGIVFPDAFTWQNLYGTNIQTRPIAIPPISLNTNDLIRMQIKNNTDSSNFTIRDFNFTIAQLGAL